MGSVFRIGIKPRRWLRSRGYGIHSPFVYELVRDVMRRRDCGSLIPELEERLHSLGTGRSVARKLSNIARHLAPERITVCAGNETWRLGGHGGGRWSEMRIIVCTKGAAQTDGLEADGIAHNGTVTAVVGGRRSRQDICMRIASRSECLCIDSADFSLFIYDKDLPVGQFNI